jgi:membrane associated rhomboid family serine protease
MSNKLKIPWGSDRNGLVYLLGANMIIFIVIRMLFIIFHNNQATVQEEYSQLTAQFTLPATFGAFIQRPWTLLLYFFSHISVFQLLSNMLWLFSFAYLLQSLGGNRYLLPSYIYGGLAGGLTFMLTFLILPQYANAPYAGILIGATPAIMAVSVTTVTLAPGYRVFPFINNGIPIWWLLAAFLVVDLLSLAFSQPALIPTHLVAAITGFLYAWGIQNGRDYGTWMGRLYNVFTGKPSGDSEKDASEKNKLFYRDKSVAPFEKKMKVTEETVNTILDKINRDGYGSLTRAERDLLKKAKDEL